MKYWTRLQVRRVYRWRGRPVGFDRRLKTQEYSALSISVDSVPQVTVISAGQNILIEGEDEDQPYVAKVLKLMGDESGQQKKALVRWFIRASEVPLSKRKLLGRDPHPQEIFYYKGRSCDDEVDAESIIRPVQVLHLDAAAPFPESCDEDTLFVKMSWDSKTFKAVTSDQVDSGSADSAPSHLKPSLPPSPPCSPPAAAPATQGPSCRVLPTPDPAVMRKASCRETWSSRSAMSAGKAGRMEAESLHSASKLSASKCLSAKWTTAARTPGIRKKLNMSSPQKLSVDQDVLDRLLNEELESEGTLAQRLSASPPRAPPPHAPPSRLTPLKTAHSAAIALKPLSVIVNRRTSSDVDSPPSPTRTRPVQTLQEKEPLLSDLPELDGENSPSLPSGAGPRTSKRMSARLVSSRIRKQLNLLENHLDSDSDRDDQDQFVPLRTELQSSSEEDSGDEEDEEAGPPKRRRRGQGGGGPRTPRSRGQTVARTPRKTPNRKATPSTPRTPHRATPSIPCRSLPARRPANILEEARIRLHVSAVPESLPCREAEFQDIYNFVESKIIDGTGGCMYISGVPGTGKTATVHEVMRCLQHAADVDEIPPFTFVEINGMKMTDPHQSYVQILQKLTGQKATPDHAAALLDKKFSSPTPRRETTVLLVDELDLLWTRKQNVMYNLFDWPTRRQARLVVLTIANTMDLPERIMINRVASRLGLTRMSFQPYTFKQLQQIITSRLDKLKALDQDALQLVSRKVAALSGDARRCLDICRRATEICEHAAADPSAPGLVGMSHVMEALNEMFSSAYTTAIRSASVQEQLFLRAVIAEFRRLGLEEATFQQVFVQHQALCRVEGLQPVSVSEGLSVCQRLGACRLLLLEPSRLGILQRVRLNVSQDDVLYALKAD
ncbi:origin recognition complex subunit 1 isoform X2 [Sphaeramia orbicularis]|uniref:origin recognition complex subunit 1 isoform X2 n=1 Tax=Sphaeramia orbicularis TaxID=375764 RepID=UPI001180E296|nr:origin recognition complex subunit 1 isoform X2 [Sphaeramia orbicularis]